MKKNRIKVLESLCRGDFLRAAVQVSQLQNPHYDDTADTEAIMSLASRVWNATRSHRNDPIFVLHKINDILFKKLGLQTNDKTFRQVIDDPARYDLHCVLEKKVTSPLSAAILYGIVAEQVGLDFTFIAIPGNYFLRISEMNHHFYVDPFANGKLLSEEEFHRKVKSAIQKATPSTSLYERLTPHQMVCRLIMQLKQIFILKGQAVEALRAVEILSCLFPNNAEITRDRGILYCEMEYFSRASEDLNSYLRRRPKADDRQEIRKLTFMLRGYRETIN